MDNNTPVLQRVEKDLARGHTHVAIQRLTTLVQTNPGDLDLRRHLGAAHYTTGNWVEAGRWTYLEPVRRREVVDAFERAYPHPRARPIALRWSPDLEPRVSPEVRAIVRTLEHQAVKTRRAAREAIPLRRVGPVRRATLRLRWALFVAWNVAVYVVGCIALIRWIW